MNIYIKPATKCALANRQKVYIKDIAEVVAEKAISSKINTLKVLDISAQKSGSFLVSVTDIIRVINQEYPNATINNVGAEDTLIDYKPKKSKDYAFVKYLKIIFTGIVLFAGAGTAIMCFYTDSQLIKVFSQFYYMVFGVHNSRPLIIEIPYSIGLALGIIVFFNHFMGKKITQDPTPLEIEMTIYESDVTETMIDALNTQRKNANI